VTEGHVAFEPLIVHAHGDMGFAVGIERGSIVIDGNRLDVLLRVTNIFEQSSGEWKVVHHHADTVPAIVTALG
jgi:ketosteroid isomerase-like protein